MASIIYMVAAGLALAGMLLTFVRLVLGPTSADRAVALDAMTALSITVITYLAAVLGRVIYLDVALVYALISFIGVVAIARYLERGI